LISRYIWFFFIEKFGKLLSAEWPGKGIFFLTELLVDADQAIIY